jgi:hypothetical protein
MATCPAEYVAVGVGTVVARIARTVVVPVAGVHVSVHGAPCVGINRALYEVPLGVMLSVQTSVTANAPAVTVTVRRQPVSVVLPVYSGCEDAGLFKLISTRPVKAVPSKFVSVSLMAQSVAWAAVAARKSSSVCFIVNFPKP